MWLAVQGDNLWGLGIRSLSKLLGVLVRVSIAVKRHQDHSNSYKGKHLTGAGLQFRGLVNYHHDRKHGGVRETRCWRQN